MAGRSARPGTPRPGAVLSQLGASWLAKLRTTLLILLPVGFLALGSPLGRGGPAQPGAALRVNQQYVLGRRLPLQRHRDADRLPGRDRRAGPVPGRATRRPPMPPSAGSDRLARHPARLVRRHPVAGRDAGAGRGSSCPSSRSAGCGSQRPTRSACTSRRRTRRWPGCPPGTTVEATLTMVAPLAARDDTYWIGTAGNPAPRYIVFDEHRQRLEPGSPPTRSRSSSSATPGQLPADLRGQRRVRVPPSQQKGYRPASLADRPVGRVEQRTAREGEWTSGTTPHGGVPQAPPRVHGRVRVPGRAGVRRAGAGEPAGRRPVAAPGGDRRAEGGGARPRAVEPVPGPPSGRRGADQPAVRAAGRDHRAQPGAGPGGAQLRRPGHRQHGSCWPSSARPSSGSAGCGRCWTARSGRRSA